VLKYGAHRFIVEVLEFAESKPELDRAEQKAIIEHRSLLGRKRSIISHLVGKDVGKGQIILVSVNQFRRTKSKYASLKRSEITRHRYLWQK